MGSQGLEVSALRREFGFLGNHIRLLRAAEDTRAAYTMVEMTWDAGFSVPPHVHSREDEATYILEGRIRFWLDGQTFEAGPGEFVIKPIGIPHAMANDQGGSCRFLEVYTPAGLEAYFWDVAQLFASGKLSAQTIGDIQATYGISPVDPGDGG